MFLPEQWGGIWRLCSVLVKLDQTDLLGGKVEAHWSAGSLPQMFLLFLPQKNCWMFTSAAVQVSASTCSYVTGHPRAKRGDLKELKSFRNKAARSLWPRLLQQTFIELTCHEATAPHFSRAPHPRHPFTDENRNVWMRRKSAGSCQPELFQDAAETVSHAGQSAPNLWAEGCQHAHGFLSGRACFELVVSYLKRFKYILKHQKEFKVFFLRS